MAVDADRGPGQDGHRCRASDLDRGRGGGRTTCTWPGGSSAMPHKRNPVSSTVILAAQAAAKGHLVTLFDAMAAAHERSAGLWHGEWHALPALFGLASGELHEARSLAEGLAVDPDRMRANLDLTRGLLFADAAAARLAPQIGREEAHRLVERAAGEGRRTGEEL